MVVLFTQTCTHPSVCSVRGTLGRGTWGYTCRTEARSRFQSHRQPRGIHSPTAADRTGGTPGCLHEQAGNNPSPATLKLGGEAISPRTFHPWFLGVGMGKGRQRRGTQRSQEKGSLPVGQREQAGPSAGRERAGRTAW